MSDAASNRAAFPTVALIVDELREVFGPKVALVYAAENGRELGQREQGGTVVPYSKLVISPATEPEGKGNHDSDRPRASRTRRNPALLG